MIISGSQKQKSIHYYIVDKCQAFSKTSGIPLISQLLVEDCRKKRKKTALFAGGQKVWNEFGGCAQIFDGS